MPYTSPATRATLDMIGATTWNAEVVDNVKWLADVRPRALVARAAVLSVANTTWTAVPWTTESLDSASIHDNTVNPSRLTIPVAGMYTVTAYVEWAINATGERFLGLNLVGTTIQYANAPPPIASSPAAVSITWVGYLAAANYLEVIAWQSSGAALDVGLRSYASLSWMGV